MAQIKAAPSSVSNEAQTSQASKKTGKTQNTRRPYTQNQAAPPRTSNGQTLRAFPSSTAPSPKMSTACIDSTWTPWMYDCAINTTTKLIDSNGKAWKVDSKYLWRMIFRRRNRACGLLDTKTPRHSARRQRGHTRHHQSRKSSAVPNASRAPEKRHQDHDGHKSHHHPLIRAHYSAIGGLMKQDLFQRFQRWLIAAIAIAILFIWVGSIWAGFSKMKEQFQIFEWVMLFTPLA